MTNPEIASLIATAMRNLSEAQRAVRDAERAIAELEGGMRCVFEPGLQALQTPPETNRFAAHIRAHLPGRPSKIDTDLELRAFILARIDTTTFSQLAQEVSYQFPPDRRVGRSAINDWWNKQRPER